MSMYRGHLLGGFAAYLAVIVLYGIWQDTFAHNFHGLLATLAGSLFPDIDIRSKGQRLFLKLLFIAVVFCLFLQASFPLMMLLIFSVLPIIFPHRGLFHDTIFVFTLSAFVAGSLIYIMPENSYTILTLFFFFYVGVISHLVLDKGMKRTFYRK